MKIDVNFNRETESARVTFFNEEFIDDLAFNKARAIVQIFAGDFALDPDMEADDFVEIISKARELEHDRFTFDISEDGIEVDFPES